jgi:hypothetical protein
MLARMRRDKKNPIVPDAIMSCMTKVYSAHTPEPVEQSGTIPIPPVYGADN